VLWYKCCRLKKKKKILLKSKSLSGPLTSSCFTWPLTKVRPRSNTPGPSVIRHHWEKCHTQTLQIRAGEGRRLVKAVSTGFITCFFCFVFGNIMLNATAQQSFNRYKRSTTISRIFHLFYPVTEAQRSRALEISLTVICFWFIWISCQGDK